MSLHRDIRGERVEIKNISIEKKVKFEKNLFHIIVYFSAIKLYNKIKVILNKIS